MDTKSITFILEMKNLSESAAAISEWWSTVHYVTLPLIHVEPNHNEQFYTTCLDVDKNQEKSF